MARVILVEESQLLPHEIKMLNVLNDTFGNRAEREDAKRTFQLILEDGLKIIHRQSDDTYVIGMEIE